jgi:hypothetical protein
MALKLSLDEEKLISDKLGEASDFARHAELCARASQALRFMICSWVPSIGFTILMSPTAARRQRQSATGNDQQGSRPAKSRPGGQCE